MQPSERDDGEEAGADQERGGADPQTLTAERGDEHEQHATGYECLAAGLGAERERVGHDDHEHHRGAGERGPTGVVDHRRDRGLELVADQAEIEAEL